jgi:hypothetical protein
VSKRLAGTKSDESTFISSLRVVAVDGVNIVDDDETAAAAAGFNVDKRSTRLLLLAALDGVSLDIEETKKFDLSRRTIGFFYFDQIITTIDGSLSELKAKNYFNLILFSLIHSLTLT